LCRKSCLIAGREGQEDDNPLPQSDAAPYGRGIANHQSGDIPVRKHRAKVEQRLGLFLASRIPTRQRRPGNQDTGSAEHAGDNKSAAPAQQRSDAAEQERQRRADGERAGVPGCYAGACFPFDAMGKRPQPGHIHACHGNARQAAESERRAAAWPHPFERAARNRKNDAGAGPRESSRQAPSAHEEHHVEVDPHALTSSALGRSQQAVAKLFEQSIPELAMDGAAIVLLDEVETLAVDRHQLSLEANPIDVHRATAAALPAWTG